MSANEKPASERVRVRRVHTRGAYDRRTIDAILDAMPLAHVGYTFAAGPYVTPTLQWREGDHVYWHGSAASRMLDAVDGADVCLTVTILDGMILARSAFHHSVNYRSVMLLGRARKLSDPSEKEARLKALTDGLFPGRWDQLRPMKHQELKATSVLELPISEASAKLRSGPSDEDEKDLSHPVWAGVIPLQYKTLTPEPDQHLSPELSPPDYVSKFTIG
jgi:nitroimidazol reductase NimA-like FMN-containing flavoprotein (pyridoxamine 5'-phosphate oxidase superfamily)